MNLERMKAAMVKKLEGGKEALRRKVGKKGDDEAKHKKQQLKEQR